MSGYGRQTEVEVADRLEELIPIMRELARGLRDGVEPQPYAAMYWLRREVSRLVARLGCGAPNLRDVERLYGGDRRGT